MAAGGIVRVSAQNMILDVPQGPLLPGRYIRIAVADQGEGIPRDLLLKIFDLFFTTKPKGRGLGLTTSYAIIAKHKGHWRLSLNWGTARRPSSIYLPALPNAPIPLSKRQGGYSTNPVMAEFRTYGFCACLLKPYQIEELSETVTRLVGER